MALIPIHFQNHPTIQSVLFLGSLGHEWLELSHTSGRTYEIIGVLTVPAWLGTGSSLSTKNSPNIRTNSIMIIFNCLCINISFDKIIFGEPSHNIPCMEIVRKYAMLMLLCNIYKCWGQFRVIFRTGLIFHYFLNNVQERVHWNWSTIIDCKSWRPS